jgi:hypothetical protein
VRCCLLALGGAAPPPQPLELIAPGKDESPPMAVFKQPATTEAVPKQPDAPSSTLIETAPPALMPPAFVPPAAMSTAGMPPASFSSPYVPYEAGPEIPPYGEKWRYMSSNGIYWYFTPQRKWMYWSQGRWVQYEPPAYSNTPVGLQPPVVARPFRRPRVNIGVGVGMPYYPYGYPYSYPGYYGGMGVGFF